LFFQRGRRDWLVTEKGDADYILGTHDDEVARLGLLFLIHEFKQNRRQSILYRVKKA